LLHFWLNNRYKYLIVKTRKIHSLSTGCGEGYEEYHKTHFSIILRVFKTAKNTKTQAFIYSSITFLSKYPVELLFSY